MSRIQSFFIIIVQVHPHQPRKSILKSAESAEHYENEEYSSETEADQAQRESANRNSWEPHEMFRSRPAPISPSNLTFKPNQTENLSLPSPAIKKPSVTSAVSFQDSVFEDNDKTKLEPKKPSGPKKGDVDDPELSSNNDKNKSRKTLCFQNRKNILIACLGVVIMLLTISNILLALKSTNSEGNNY